MPSKISKEDHDDIVERADDGESLSSIGNDYRVSRATIEYHVKGFCSHVEGDTGWPSKDDKEVVEDELVEEDEEEEEEAIESDDEVEESDEEEEDSSNFTADGPPETFAEAERKGMYQSGPNPTVDEDDEEGEEEEEESRPSKTLRDEEPEERDDEEIDELLTPNTVDVFKMLSSERRRNVIRALATFDDECTLSDLSEKTASIEYQKSIRDITSKERKRVYVGLYQTHLDKISDTGIIDYDKERGYIDINTDNMRTIVRTMYLIENIDVIDDVIILKDRKPTRFVDWLFGKLGAIKNV